MHRGVNEPLVSPDAMPPRRDPPGVDVMPPFEVLCDTHVDFVWRIARRLGVAEAALDDAVQEVFLVAHRRAAEFEGRGTVRAWLYGIVRRVARDPRPSRRERYDAQGTPDAVDPRPAHDRLEPAEALRTQSALRDDPARRRPEGFVPPARERIHEPRAARLPRPHRHAPPAPSRVRVGGRVPCTFWVCVAPRRRRGLDKLHAPHAPQPRPVAVSVRAHIAPPPAFQILQLIRADAHARLQATLGRVCLTRSCPL